MLRSKSWVQTGLLSFALSAGVQADDLAQDIAQIHVEAIGGVDRLERLESFRAAGESRVGDHQLNFQMWAQRPRSIRIEVMTDRQTLIQGWDGVGDPWLQGGVNGEVQAMPSAMAARFKTESEFDDPLYQAAERGFTLEYAGEGEVAGRPVIKLLATRDITEQSTLFLAADTYFIVQQNKVRLEPNRTRIEVRTSYADFRPVLGVTLPHRIVVRENDQIVSDVMLTWIEPNPPMEPDAFRMPNTPPPPPPPDPILRREDLTE